jgi:hypothetical protein
MTTSALNYCTSRLGAFDETGRFPTTSHDMATTMAAYAKVSEKTDLALFFHGGLLSRADGVNLAKRLQSRFPEPAATQAAGRNVYPYSFVWESGLLDELLRNLPEIVSDIVFQRILSIVAATARTILNAQQPPAVPTMSTILPTTAAVAGNFAPGVAPTAAQIDEVQRAVENDPLIRTAKARVAATRSSLLSPEILAAIAAEEQQTVRLGILALKAGVVLSQMIHRFSFGRDHGFHETLIEEILRAYYLVNAGFATWTEAKAGAAAAFSPDPASYVGTNMVRELVKMFDAKKRPRVALVAHGAGALYVCPFLAAMDSELLGKSYGPDIRFDVIVLAPAVRVDVWSAMSERYGHMIGDFRMFSMLDAQERNDALLRRAGEPAASPANEILGQIYRRSLLYFTSGVLEDEDGDTPLLGMVRFFSGAGAFGPGRNAMIDALRESFAAAPQRRVLSSPPPAVQPAPAQPPIGLRCTSRRHEDFITDAATLESICYVLRSHAYDTNHHEAGNG